MLRHKWKREIIMAGRQRANGEGSIRERYPGCWEGRYTAGYDILTGKRIQKGVFAKTRKECAAKLARAIQQDTGPYYRKGKGYDSQPLSTWIRLWFDSYTKPNLRPSSADGYRSMIENHIIPVLGHIQLSKLSSIQIQRFYNDLHTQGRLDNHGNRKYEPLSASTVKHIHAVLSGALKQAVMPSTTTTHIFSSGMTFSFWKFRTRKRLRSWSSRTICRKSLCMVLRTCRFSHLSVSEVRLRQMR